MPVIGSVLFSLFLVLFVVAWIDQGSYGPKKHCERKCPEGVCVLNGLCDKYLDRRFGVTSVRLPVSKDPFERLYNFFLDVRA